MNEPTTQLDHTAARALTDKINTLVENAWHLIVQAFQERAWAALGYNTWDDYCAAEFAGARLRLPRENRQEIVVSLREAGMSTRAIASATGTHHKTIENDLKSSGGENSPPEPITGTDGKRYQPTRTRTRIKREEPDVSPANWDLIEGWHNCAVTDLIHHVEPHTIDVFITDPPYPAEFLPVYGELSQAAAKLLKPGGLCVAMAGQSYLPEIHERLSEALTYHWTIAYLTPGGQAVQLWNRNVNTFWKPVLVYVNGTYEGKWFGDVAKSDVNDNDKEHHRWGQSESGMADLIRRISQPGDLICDPFAGGGTTAVVATQLGRRVIASDIDQDALDAARRRFA